MLLISGFSLTSSSMIAESIPDRFIKSPLTSKLILLWIWLPCGLFVSFAYRSALLASLVTITYEKPIDTAQDVLDSGLPLLVNTPGWESIFFSTSTSPLYQKMNNEIVEPYTHRDAPRDKMRNGEVVFLGVEDTIKGKEDIWRLGNEVIISSVGSMVTTKNSRMLSKINMFLMGMKEFGIYEHFREIYFLKKLGSKYYFKQKKTRGDNVLRFGQFSPVLLILAVGLGSAFVSVVLEICWREIVKESQRYN